MTKRSVSRSVGAGALAAALAFGIGSAAWANPVPGSGPTTGGTSVTLPVPGKPAFAQIAGGINYALAIGADGSISGWGDNGSGQLGDGTSSNSRSLPAPVLAPPGLTFIRVTAGNSESFAIASDGNAYAWGMNNFGQLGNGQLGVGSLVPVAVQMPAGVAFNDIDAGDLFSVAIGSDGNAYAWGRNAFGQLGDGTATNRSAPVPVQTPAGVTFTRVAAGIQHAVALGSDGNAYAWGEGAFGALGDGAALSSSTPVQVLAPAGVTFTQVDAGELSSLALGSDGNAYAWGYNGDGQLGDGTITQRNSPIQVQAPVGVSFVQVVAGDGYSLGLASDGRAYAWGSNALGRLGDGTTTASALPVQVQAPPGVTFAQLAAGASFSAALGSDGRVYTWGHNHVGQLGDGTTTSSLIPVEAGGSVSVTGVTFDGDPGVGLLDNGDGTISVSTPAHAAGPVDVVVEWTLNGLAQTPVAYAGGFTYAAPAAAPTVTDPVSQSIAAGGAASFSVAATGNPAPNVSWEVSSDDGAAWQPIAADSAATVAVDGLSVAIASAPAGHDGYRYRAVASNSEGSATSAAAVLTVVSTTGGGGSSSGAGNGRADGGSGVLATTGGEPLLVWVAVGGIALLAGAGILTARAPRRRAL